MIGRARFVSVLVALAWPVAAQAQTYPAKPVRIVVGFPAGGGLDFTTRLLAEKLQEMWRQPVNVDNRAGSSGMAGTELVVRAAKDGYTLASCSPAEIALNGALYARMPYDPLRDLAPVSLSATYANLIAVHASIPARNLKELISLSKKTRGGLGFASGSIGSTQHLTGEWLKRYAGANFVHLQYRGGGTVMIDLVGGQIPVAILGAAPMVPHVKAGRLRGIAVTTKTRTPALPEVPTLAEAGVTGFESSQWFGILAPAGTARAVIAKLNADLQRVLAFADVKERLAERGGETFYSTPEAFGLFIRSENAKYAKIIAEAGIKAE